MKKSSVVITAVAIGMILIGLYSVPTVIGEQEVAGVDPLPVSLAAVMPTAESSRGEWPCEGTRYEFETPHVHGVSTGEGEGRAIGFSVDETVWITSFGILADMTTDEYHDVVLYESEDGHSAGSVIHEVMEWVVDEGWGWYDIPIQTPLIGGKCYVLNWRPTDHGDGDWADSLLYYDDSGLPYTVGPFELLEGIEGYDAENPGNFLHAQFRVCVDEPWPLCFYDENYEVTNLYVRISGSVIHGQALVDEYVTGAVNGTFYNGKVFLSIDYLLDRGLRFYDVDLSTRTGTTWGVSTATGEFYDEPHSCQFHPCGAFAGYGSTETGALEKEAGGDTRR